MIEGLHAVWQKIYIMFAILMRELELTDLLELWWFFQTLFDKMHLVDFPLKGVTWWNNKDIPAMCQTDRFLVSTECGVVFVWIFAFRPNDNREHSKLWVELLKEAADDWSASCCVAEDLNNVHYPHERAGVDRLTGAMMVFSEFICRLPFERGHMVKQ